MSSEAVLLLFMLIFKINSFFNSVMTLLLAFIVVWFNFRFVQ